MSHFIMWGVKSIHTSVFMNEVNVVCHCIKFRKVKVLFLCGSVNGLKSFKCPFWKVNIMKCLFYIGQGVSVMCLVLG